MATDMGSARAEAQRSGESALVHAEAIAQQLKRVQQDAVQLRLDMAQFSTGAAGEQRLADEILAHLDRWQHLDWRVLFDRHWPGTARGNIDLVVVGPPGVVVIDAKAWGPAAVEKGRLRHGEFDATRHVNAVRNQADTLNWLLTQEGIPAAQLTSVVVLVNSQAKPKKVLGVTVVGLSKLSALLVGLGARFDQDQIHRIADVLDGLLPPNAEPVALGSQPTAIAAEQLRLAGSELRDAVLQGARRGEIERWMCWLHPDQARLTATRFAGPARLRGPAGTGKTVVALHRAHAQATQPGDKVLMLSPTTTLSKLHKELFGRLAPDADHRVEFVNVHRWCVQYLRRRGIDPQIEDGTAAFNRAWAESRGAQVLGSLDVSQEYWRQELRFVIKGRNVTDFEEYLQLDRRGRRVPLREQHRRAVWDLFETYQADLTGRQRWDWDDVVRNAHRELVDDERRPKYSSIIVDEVQDFSMGAVQLVSALATNGENGLLLVGDGRQQVFPGGFRLHEAGVVVPGARSIVLDINYRNAASIMRRARQVLADTELPDFDDDPDIAKRRTRLTRDKGSVFEATFTGRAQMEQALRRHLEVLHGRGVGWGGVALLLNSNSEMGMWTQRLSSWNIPSITLQDYEGRSSSYVKVGTYDRAKGLEFPYVVLPAVPALHSATRTTNPEADERRQLLAQRLYVAMTRAIDGLWIGHV